MLTIRMEDYQCQATISLRLISPWYRSWRQQWGRTFWNLFQMILVQKSRLMWSIMMTITGISTLIIFSKGVFIYNPFNALLYSIYLAFGVHKNENSCFLCATVRRGYLCTISCFGYWMKLEWAKSFKSYCDIAYHSALRKMTHRKVWFRVGIHKTSFTNL